MKVFLRSVLLLATLVASSSVLSAQTSTPPVSDGVSREDHEVLEKMVRKSHRKASMSASDGQKAVIARDYIDNYLFAERNFNKKHMIVGLGGHSVYAEPSSVVVRANWADNGEEGMTIDGDGYYLSMVDRSAFVSDDSSYLNGKSVSEFRKEYVDSTLRREMIMEDQSLFASLISIDYRPVDIELEGSAPAGLIAGQTGRLQVLATDLAGLYVYDGYDLTITSTTPDIVEVIDGTVTTGADGTAQIKVKCLAKGAASVRAEFHFTNGTIVSEAVEDIEFEVGPAETYRYHATVEDNLKTKISYTLDGYFSVYGEKSADAIAWTVVSSPVDMTWASGKESSETAGVFIDGRRDNSVCICFDPEKIGAVTEDDIFSKAFGGASEDMMDMAMAMLTGEAGKNVAEYEMPMCIFVPAKEGTYSFKFRLDEMMSLGEAGVRAAMSAQVIPGVDRISSMMGDIFKLAMRGEMPSMEGSITVEKVEEVPAGN